MIDHLSYSSISMYLACPESWRRKYIAKETTITTIPLAFGSAIHGTVEDFVMGKGELLQLWPENWQKVTEGKEIFWGIDTPEEHYNEGIRIFSNEQIAYNLATLKNPRSIERKVELNVPGVPIPVIGYIDIITQDGVPGDFKTSARSWTSDQAAKELQPLFYLAALSQAGETIPDYKFRHYTIIKTKTPKFEIFETTHRATELFFLYDMIKRVWQGIGYESFPLNPTGWKCDPKYCDFYLSCRGKYNR